ncbi:MULTISPECIES: nucleoside deaminase [Brevibacillus]|jgi:guanine deaminase|uniref:Guanine deaminase n=1 Tax=Brevibacillus parabrevis TaxID=54914 RepID=A0A4Y3PFK4_BREPA|nr:MULTISPECIES: nucleoside deaminase [Brevibacillus]KZE47969.1 guanine deaminase [Brevibacillus parabrevis]MBU8715355.1 nucleoside deaminase [Brevibacillus parabrevis]MDH6351971.1 guanine deaminase [Brevibacillus sp. 1238]MDR4999703.1 nucleoside deaminase [Brevibacillus parabrevis]MED1724861.1 nucleoside deaminase [Brevibacillus parabrevis]
MEQETWMEHAVNLALDNVTASRGGPFGAIVVKDGQIVGRGRNEVTATNDPTAHAEVQAIREACQKLGTFQLDDCELYTSCEPCPMCLGAIYWARPRAVYYACTKEDAARVGFDDQFIYEQIMLPHERRSIPFRQMELENRQGPFLAWEQSEKRIEY